MKIDDKNMSAKIDLMAHVLKAKRCVNFVVIVFCESSSSVI